MSATVTSSSPGNPSEEAGIQPFNVTLLVRRYDPESGREAYWEDFDVPMYPTCLLYTSRCV